MTKLQIEAVIPHALVRNNTFKILQHNARTAKETHVLSDFMRCPVFIGNQRLSWESSKHADRIMYKPKQRKTIIEKGSHLLEKAHSYCVDHWMLKTFDRGRRLGKHVINIKKIS